MVHYRHRKDKQTTLYSIVVDVSFRRKSLAKMLIEALKTEAYEHEQKVILLKCPQELEANTFYKAIGFNLIGTEEGKHRGLNLWQLEL